MKKGTYTKHFNIGEDAILSFDATCETKDNHFEAGKICNTNGFQCVENRKEMKENFEFEYTDNGFIHDIQKYFNKLLYSFYNIYGERVKNILVQFDFENSTITESGTPSNSGLRWKKSIIIKPAKALASNSAI